MSTSYETHSAPKETYSSIAIKRIFNDMKDLNKDPLDKEGIYHYFDEDNISNAYIMIIGPEDTPYENGFYFFKFSFPTSYPFSPPQVKFCTLDGNVRFNPNLYTYGKVCLSLINTWEGPKWTSCQTVRSVLISLRGLVLGVKYPLQNEPGYETETGVKAEAYNNVIQHENYRVAVVKMIEYTPSGFEYFKPIMIDYLKNKYIRYFQKLTELSKNDGKYISSPVYSMHTTYNYYQSLKSIQNILLQNGFEIPKVNITPIVSKEEEKSEDNITLILKPPSVNPNNFYKGYQMISDKDGKLYEVKKGLNKKNRWALVEGSDSQGESVVIHKEPAVIQKEPMVAQKEPVVIQKEPVVIQKEPVVADDKEDVSSVSIIELDLTKKKTVPSEAASNYEVGFVKQSDNDKNYYVVKEILRANTTYKRWSKIADVKALKILEELSKDKTLGKKIIKEKKTVKNSLLTELNKTDNVAQIVKTIDILETKEESQKTRKAPNQSAKDYEVGYELISDNDGKIYVVKQVGTGDKQFKRWVLKK
jgi:ubiquitin-protein ligase